MPMRWKLTIEYDGRPFMGWQRQAHGASVQEEIERAIERFSGESPLLHVAGRTDARVHALGQVAHFDLEKATTARTVREALNAHLRPHPIAILKAEPAPPGFHARTSARLRRYRYVVLNRPARPTLDDGRVWHVPQSLDDEAMRTGAATLIGRHDFSTFRDSLCQAKSPIRTLDAFDVTRAGEEIHIEAKARSFLHHQVRNMAGTLKLVGLGQWSPDDVATALEARDRRAGGPTAPAEGLYLVEIQYGR